MKPFIPSKVAEIVFALIFAYFGYLHFKNVDMMGGMVPGYLPGDGKIWIFMSGGAMILAAIAIITGFQKTLACYLLATLLIIFVLIFHLKTFDKNPGNLLKDAALAMAAILIGNRPK